MSLSKLILPAIISVTRFSDPAISAPDFFASSNFPSSHSTATLIFFPFPWGRLTIVLILVSSFFFLRFNLNEMSMDSSNLVVQFFLTFFIASSISFTKMNMF